MIIFVLGASECACVYGSGYGRYSSRTVQQIYVLLRCGHPRPLTAHGCVFHFCLLFHTEILKYYDPLLSANIRFDEGLVSFRRTYSSKST